MRVRHHALPAALMHSVIEKGGIFNPNEWQKRIRPAWPLAHRKRIRHIQRAKALWEVITPFPTARLANVRVADASSLSGALPSLRILFRVELLFC